MQEDKISIQIEKKDEEIGQILIVSFAGQKYVSKDRGIWIDIPIDKCRHSNN